MRDYMDSWLTPPKRVTSPTWGPPHLHVNRPLALQRRRNVQVNKRSALESLNNDQRQTTTAKKSKTFRLVKQKLLHVHQAFW